MKITNILASLAIGAGLSLAGFSISAEPFKTLTLILIINFLYYTAKYKIS